MKPRKPMLAAKLEPKKGITLDKVVYPVLGSPKYDGIRASVQGGRLLSRSLKDIPNRFTRAALLKPDAAWLEGCDGELIVPGTFQDQTSAFMSEDGEPNFTFYVFDDVRFPDVGFETRVGILDSRALVVGHPRVRVVKQQLLTNRAELDAYLGEQLALGHEGIMLRKPDGPHKEGYSTFREGWLIKVKPFEDDEAVVVGFEEEMANTNEAKTNALGRTERSSHKANLVGKGTLGALVVENKEWGRFNVGTGFDRKMKDWIWANRPKVLGHTVNFQYQLIGSKDKPRIPSFRGFRDKRDLS